MRLDRVAFAQALDTIAETDAPLPRMDSAALAAAFPALTQSLTQVLHNTEEETKKLLSSNM